MLSGTDPIQFVGSARYIPSAAIARSNEAASFACSPSSWLRSSATRAGAVIGLGTSVNSGPNSSSIFFTRTSTDSKNAEGSSSSRCTAVTNSDCLARVSAT